VLAGGASLLNAGDASALACGNGFIYTQVSSNPAVVGECTSPVAGNDHFVAVDHDYTPNEFNKSGMVDYVLNSTDLPKKNRFVTAFIDADVDTAAKPWSFKYTKEVFDYTLPVNGNPGVIGPKIGTLNFSNVDGLLTSDGQISILSSGPAIYVKDSWTATGGVQVDVITNTFSAVPGPLPILGAGAAFGFSRKLRSRIKTARTS
jgi:hypothetical protein